jgi:glycine oxidase
MEKIAIIGCGIIGATIAYELSLLDRFTIEVFDRAQPAQGSTGAALGVLMGIISHKVKGRAWHLRETSIRRYRELIPTLERATGMKIPHNDRGILKLSADDGELEKWQKLADTRAAQGWTLEIWSRDRILANLPQINPDLAHHAIYSPQDLQIEPIPLLHALIAAARSRGVAFHFDRSIVDLAELNGDRTTTILTAGLGSSDLAPSIDLRPVWGQAIHYRLPPAATVPAFQPVISYRDVHLVPKDGGEYWVGATVEFGGDDIQVPAPDALSQLQQQSIEWFPILERAEINRTWQGSRPRPHNRPAPIIERLSDRLLVATGHYRNGILLAPATARSAIDLLASTVGE